MATKIIVRFDDICPNMNWDAFLYIKEKLQNLGIKSLLGVIPDNQDKNLLKFEYRENFFELIYSYKIYGDTISQHGTHHNYTTNSEGILKINKRSEFSGHEFQYQYNLIKKGKNILEKNNCWQPVFMAPSHSFDEKTIKCLIKLGFKSISDGYGFFPFEKKGIDFVPQISARPFNTGFGLATICIHVNSLNEKEIDNLLNFLFLNRKRIINFQEYVNIKTPHRYIVKSLEILSSNIMYSIRKFRN